MRDKYLIDKPKLGDINITKKIFEIYFLNNLERYSDKEYLYWDSIKHKPLPEGISTSEELWLLIKIMRVKPYKSPIKTENGEYFSFSELPFSKKLLHEIDKNASGVFFTNQSETDKKRFIANGMLEEAISSSQLEGASTTTKEAKKMIQSNRRPRNTDEQMILNNYNAMQYIKDELIHKDLELEDLIDLQSLLTKDTLENPNDVGKIRSDKDEIIVLFEDKVAHIPPKEKFLKQELQNLLKFANSKQQNTENFIHPIISAILLHFWIGYLHPFCDGNGRTARALFYWYLLKNEYFGFAYLPVSSIIKKSKTSYAKSYIYSEQDELDVTYFINYNLKKIQLALNEFKTKVNEKFIKQKNDSIALEKLGLNERQSKLLYYFLREPNGYTTISLHKNYYNVSRGTARTDLIDLQDRGYIYSTKSGRMKKYFAVENLKEILP